MRLNSTQISLIKKLVNNYLLPYSTKELWLFGSRVDDKAVGGDIDLCLRLDESDYSLLGKIKRKLRPELEEKLDIPVDLIIQNINSKQKEIVNIVTKSGIRLI